MGELGHVVPDCYLIRFPSTPEGPAEAATNLKQPGRFAEAEAGDGLQGVQIPPLPAPDSPGLSLPHPPTGQRKETNLQGCQDQDGQGRTGVVVLPSSLQELPQTACSQKS